jgi:hypothetical protein
MRAVVRHLNTAWLEYQDKRDGIVFTHAASARLGFNNALSTLPPGPGGRRTRLASNLPDLRIRVHEHTQGGATFRSILAQPHASHKDALESWICSPGVDSGELVVDPDASEPIDLLVVSGHGSSGMVFGNGSGKYGDLEMTSAFIEGAGKPRSGRLKCIIVPSCNNLEESFAHAWFPAFDHEKPVYLILGYGSTYSGGAIGARVMAKFVDALATDQTKPIIEAWAAANRRSRQPWAALAAKGAESMNVADWVNGNLATLRQVTDLVYFDDRSPGGVTPPLEGQIFQLRWVMENGIELTPENNGARHPNNGLFDGRPGKIVIRAMTPAVDFLKGQEVFLRIHLYRTSKELDIDKLLEFDTTLLFPQFDTGHPIVNPERGTSGRPQNAGDVDGFRIVVPSDGDTLELPFRVKPDATKAFKADGPGPSHGRFLLEFAPNNIWNREADGSVRMSFKFFGSTTGALLRP